MIIGDPRVAMLDPTDSDFVRPVDPANTAFDLNC